MIARLTARIQYLSTVYETTEIDRICDVYETRRKEAERSMSIVQEVLAAKREDYQGPSAKSFHVVTGDVTSNACQIYARLVRKCGPLSQLECASAAKQIEELRHEVDRLALRASRIENRGKK